MSRAGRGARAAEFSIDEQSGNSYSAWLAMGSPQSPTADQVSKLHAAAKMRATSRELSRIGAGKAQLALVLPRQSVKLIVIELAR
jgi:xylan 1,4-beta-xylosidase